MKNKIISVLSLLLVFVTGLFSFTIPTFALSWDGSSAGGGGNGTAAGPNGYAIRFTDSDTNLLGYRFSAVNKSGANKVTKVIDVFRNTTYGNYEYDNAYKFKSKYNKKQLIDNQNGNYSTIKTSTNCFKEAEMGFATALPNPSGMQTWQNNATNLQKILSTLGVGSISNLKNGDKILVEPIYDVRLEGTYHALSVVEIAVYGKHILGASSDGGSSTNANSWGFISKYTNRFYPNALFTPNGQGLWTGVTAATSRLSFHNIINQGYGVGIAYTETKADFTPALTVKECRAYKGMLPTKTYLYGTSTGDTFSKWTLSKGYPVADDTIFFSVSFPKESENCYVKQTIWIDGTQVGTRTGYSNSLEWYDAKASKTIVAASKAYFKVKARVDWIETNGTVKQTGVEKVFYVPARPIATREKVTAYNEEGIAQAYSSSSETRGKLYFGQKVQFQYLYGATTTWSSSNNVRAVADRWNGTSWTHIYTANTDGEDVSAEKVTLSKTQSFTKNSSIGTYVIPVPANEDANSFRLKFSMSTAWASDTANTQQTSTYYLPVVKPDVGIVDMKLVDSDGRYVDRSNLTVGQVLTVHYFYQNNTGCTIYVKGYDDDLSQISGTFAIPAGKTIEVEGASHTVPNKRTYSIWGGVYLDTVARGITRYESDNTNNASAFICKTSLPLKLTAITPNASYREGTDVISSFYLYNDSYEDYTPEKAIKVRLRVYKNGTSTPFITINKNVVVPALEKSLVYFKWTVPTGLNGKDVTLKADVYDGSSYGGLISNDRATIPYTYYTTPDTHYEEQAPRGFVIPPSPSETTGGAIWQEYVYENGSFVKKKFGIGISKSSINTLTPETGETAEKTDGVWTMRSGYGFSLYSRALTASVTGYTLPDADAYTVPQYAYVLYPEYLYAFANGEATTLERYNNTSATPYYRLPKTGNYGHIHFIPLWYPDGNYTVKIIHSDCWTPVGMITRTIIPNAMTIKGNSYDDWYVGRK